MKYRITFFGNKGTMYSYIDDEYDYLTSGEWDHPFPNTEEESTAFGLVETFEQSDYWGRNMLLEGEEIVKLKVEEVEKY